MNRGRKNYKYCHVDWQSKASIQAAVATQASATACTNPEERIKIYTHYIT